MTKNRSQKAATRRVAKDTNRSYTAALNLTYPEDATAPTPVKGNGKVISIFSASGGVGVSTLVLNFAETASLAKKRVAVVEANSINPSLGLMLNAYEPTIAQLATEPKLTSEVLATYMVSKANRVSPERLQVLLQSILTTDRDPSVVTPKLISDVLDLLRQDYDYIFVDWPVADQLNPMSQLMLQQSDFLIPVVTQNMPRLFNIYEFLSQSKDKIVATNQNIHVLTNKARLAGDMDLSIREVTEIMAPWLFLGTIDDSRIWQVAANDSTLVAGHYQKMRSYLLQLLTRVTNDAEWQDVVYLDAAIETRIDEKRCAEHFAKAVRQYNKTHKTKEPAAILDSFRNKSIHQRTTAFEAECQVFFDTSSVHLETAIEAVSARMPPSPKRTSGWGWFLRKQTA